MTEPAMAIVQVNGSSRSSQAQPTAKSGIRYVTVEARLGPMRAISRQYMTNASPVHGTPSAIADHRAVWRVALLCYPRLMTRELTLRQAGGSVSATLPKDMAARLRLEAGDRVFAVETERGILLTPYDPDAERALKVAAKAAKKYRAALRELAK